MGIKHSIKYVMIALGVLSLVPTVAMGTLFVNRSNTFAQTFTPCPAGDLDLSSATGLQTEALFAAGGVVNVLFNAECAVDTVALRLGRSQYLYRPGTCWPQVPLAISC